MSTAIAPSPSAPQVLTQRLQNLRSRVVRCLLVTGAARVLWLALGICLADLAIDWLFRLDTPQRVIVLVVAIAALAWVVFRWIVRPLGDLPGDDALCLAVEGRHRQLGESVISALQFSRESDYAAKGVSPQLVQATVDQGLQRAQEIDFNDVIDRQISVRYSALLLVATLILLGGIVGISSGAPLLSTWYQRNILLADKPWPQDTYLIIVGVDENNTITVPRGDDWTLVVKIDPDSRHKQPASVTVDVDRPEDRYSDTMKKEVGNEDNALRFEYPFKQVTEEFRLRVRSGRSRTAWVNVKLVNRPRVEILHLVYTPPAYTGQEETILPPDASPYRVLKGGSLHVEGTANQILSAANLVRDGKVIPMSLEEKNFHLDLDPESLESGMYRIHLVDTSQPVSLASKERAGFSLRLQIDTPPRVSADVTGVSTMVTPRAVVPLIGFARDDFAINDLRLVYEWLPIEGETTGAVNKGELRFDTHTELLPTAEISIRDLMDMAPFQLPTPAIFRFWFEATDNNNISGPGIGQSVETTLRIVSDAELRTDLLRREKELRQDMERHRAEQDTMTTEIAAIHAELVTESLASIPPDSLADLIRTHRNQQLLATNLDVVASRLVAIVVEVQNNRLEEEGGVFQTRLNEHIIWPIRDLVEVDIPDVTRQLERARRLGNDPVPRDEAMAQVVSMQRDIITLMDDILKHMVKVEGYQEALNLLYEIQRTQQDVFNRTVEERRERIRQLLEGGGQDSPEDGEDEEDKETGESDSPADNLSDIPEDVTSDSSGGT